MQIYNFELGPLGVNTFLIVPENSDAIIIDAPESSYDEVQQILAPLNKKVSSVLLTHAHWDHIWDAKKFQNSNAKIYAHLDGKDMLEKDGAQRAYMFGFEGLESVKIDQSLYDGQVLKFGDCKLEVRHTPGHCAGSVSFILTEKNLAFVGDLIFAGSIGRTDLPSGNYTLLEKSIKEKIYTLSDEVKLLCGHGAFTNVGEEKISNPYVRA